MTTDVVDARTADQRLAELTRLLEAWIRHLEAVPSDVSEVSREIVASELRGFIDGARA